MLCAYQKRYDYDAAKYVLHDISKRKYEEIETSLNCKAKAYIDHNFFFNYTWGEGNQILEGDSHISEGDSQILLILRALG